MGPLNTMVGCSKSCARRVKFELNFQYLTIVFQGPALMSNVMILDSYMTHGCGVETNLP